MPKRRGKMYQTEFRTPSGQRIRRSIRTADRKKAEEFEDKLKAQYWDAEVLGKPNFIWEDAVTQWLKDKQNKASLASDCTILRWVDPHLRGMAVRSISPLLLAQIEGFRGGSNATKNRTMGLIRAILGNCKKYGWITEIPYIKKLPEDERRIRWITHIEAERLLGQLPEHLERMARFSLCTGLRASNVMGLEWSQVDLSRKIAWIHGDQAKAKKAISVPLSQEAVDVIRSQIGKNHTFVFTYKGKRVHQVSTKAWWNALKRAGIDDFRWHDLRHTWASWHVQNGTPLQVLMELGGWSDMKMVLRYAHLGHDHLSVYADNVKFQDRQEHRQDVVMVV